MSSALFSPLRLRGVTLPNRTVVAPMCQYSAERDGSANDWHLMHYGSQSVAGFGCLVFEATAVEPNGRITYVCLGLYSDETEAALGRVVKFCHERGNTALGIQLTHSGRKGSSTKTPEGAVRYLTPDEGAWPLIAPSPVPLMPDAPMPEVLDRAGMDAVIDSFVDSAKRADRIGFDLVELHGAHGYLMHQYLSPVTNRRDDEYGGSLANRMRYPLEIFAAVRNVWPDDKPLGIRISATDHIEGGLGLEDTTIFSHELKALGCDFVDVSTGGLAPEERYAVFPGYQVPYSAHIRREVDIPTMTVGMITRPRHAEAIVAGGEADMVAMARGVLYDPRWAWHAAEELGAEVDYAVQYVRCRPAMWPEAFVDDSTSTGK